MNAKTEFLRDTKGYNIIGVEIFFGGSYNDYNDNDDRFILPLLYSDIQYEKMLKFLDREYDDGYGGQQLFGLIMCGDDIWFERDEYDGAESWKLYKYPNLKDIFGDNLVLKYKRKMKLNKIEKNQ